MCNRNHDDRELNEETTRSVKGKGKGNVSGKEEEVAEEEESFGAQLLRHILVFVLFVILHQVFQRSIMDQRLHRQMDPTQAYQNFGPAGFRTH